MRALLLTALLASVAAPAIAAPRDRDHRSDQSDRSDRGSNHAERAQRPERAERPQREAPRVRPQMQQPARVAPSGDSVANWRSTQREASRTDQRTRAPAAMQEWAARTREARNANRDDARQRQDYARSRDTVRYGDRTNTVRVDRQRQVQTAQRRAGNHTQWTSRDRDNWRGQWRNDRRYDWRDYRNQHRSIFRLGAYFDPFGYNNYRRFEIGFRLQPNYYNSRYWISDPYMYRLPYAPPGYQWIRYYDDAVLIDTWSGQVTDVLYNFFW